VKAPAARIHALDISGEALNLARRNAAAHGVAERIAFCRGDGLGALPGGLELDLIVSNPPYIPTAEIASLQPEVRDHDPRLALDGGADGLDYYRHLASEAGPRLEPGGRIMLEMGDGQAELVGSIFSAQNWIVEEASEDYSRRPRVLVGRRGAR
jgi:release factor glutamine methyltransferase